MNGDKKAGTSKTAKRPKPINQTKSSILREVKSQEKTNKIPCYEVDLQLLSNGKYFLNRMADLRNMFDDIREIVTTSLLKGDEGLIKNGEQYLERLDSIIGIINKSNGAIEEKINEVAKRRNVLFDTIQEQETSFCDFRQFIFDNYRSINCKANIDNSGEIISVINYGLTLNNIEIRYNTFLIVINNQERIKYINQDIVDACKLGFLEVISNARFSYLLNFEDNYQITGKRIEIYINDRPKLWFNSFYFPEKTGEPLQSPDGITVQFQEKLQGKALGFIIVVNDINQPFRSVLYAKKFYNDSYLDQNPKFTDSSVTIKFPSQSNKKIKTIDLQTKSAPNPNLPKPSKTLTFKIPSDAAHLKTSSGDGPKPKPKAKLPHFDIRMEYFGYCLLNLLGKAPDFTVIRSIALNGPLIVMNEIPKDYCFLDKEGVIEDIQRKNNQFTEFCKNIQLLRFFHHLFGIDDFHERNVAVYEGDIKVVDLWTSYSTLSSILRLSETDFFKYQFQILGKLLNSTIDSIIKGSYEAVKIPNLLDRMLHYKFSMIWLTSETIKIFQHCEIFDGKDIKTPFGIQIEARKEGVDENIWACDQTKLFEAFIFYVKRYVESTDGFKQVSINKGDDGKWSKFWESFSTYRMYKEVIDVLKKGYVNIYHPELDTFSFDMKTLNEYFNQNIQTFLISIPANEKAILRKERNFAKISDILERIFTYKEPTNTKADIYHMVLVFCEDTQLNGIPKEITFHPIPARIKSRIVIMVNRIFLYDLIFQFLSEANRPLSMIETYHIHSEFNISLEFPEDRIIELSNDEYKIIDP